MIKSKEERLKEIVKILEKSDVPISGSQLAKEFNVSRQVIVQDISLLRAKDLPIISTYKGYVLEKASSYSRVIKVRHKDEQIGEEMNSIVDLGASIDDVFVRHKLYGIIKAPMNIKSRKDVSLFVEEIHKGVSSPLKNLTESYHYHTISAENESILDEVEDMLEEKNFLVKK